MCSSLSVASVMYGQPQSDNLTWKIRDLSNSHVSNKASIVRSYNNTPAVIRLRGEEGTGHIRNHPLQLISGHLWNELNKLKEGKGIGSGTWLAEKLGGRHCSEIFKHLILTPKHHYVLKLAQLSFPFFPRRWNTSSYSSKARTTNRLQGRVNSSCS